jgi:hypothetical protein
MSAYNFLGLVNDVNRKLNEVELTSSTFASAVGYYSQAKDAVNASLRYINHSQFEWPFNHVEAEDILTAGQVRYSFPSDMKTVDMESFRIKRDSSLGNDTRKLKIISYEEYLSKHVDAEYNTSDTGIRAIPQYIFRTPSFEYGLVPAPDKAYELVYEYYRLQVDLENYDDVPSVPEQFRHIIVDGAMYYSFQFRSDLENSSLSFQKFQEGIKDMRTIYINRYDYLRSTVVNQNQTNTKVT